MQTDTAAIAAINASLAAQSAANAEQAHTERCKIELLTYQPKGATVAQMQSYAACVQRVHPTDDSTLALKVCVGVVLVCAAVGAAHGLLKYGDAGEALAGGCLGAAAGGILLISIGAVVFLFS